MRCFHLRVRGDMGIGVQREARRVVTQHTADGLDVHAVLQGHGREGVPKSWNLILNLYYSFLSIDETKL